jgi:hypothetical protein
MSFPEKPFSKENSFQWGAVMLALGTGWKEMEGKQIRELVDV